MTPREEAIRLAKEAGVFIPTWFSQPTNESWQSIERLIQLAKNEAYREAAEICSERNIILSEHIRKAQGNVKLDPMSKSFVYFTEGAISALKRNKNAILSLIKEPK